MKANDTDEAAMKAQVKRLEQLILQMRGDEIHHCGDGLMYRWGNRKPRLAHALNDDFVFTDSRQDQAAVTVIRIGTIVSPRPRVLMHRAPEWVRLDHDSGEWVPNPDATPLRVSRWRQWWDTGRDIARLWQMMNKTGVGIATPDEVEHLVEHVAATLGVH